MSAARSAAARWLEIVTVSTAAGEAVLEMPTRPEMGNMLGVVHGGFISLLADSAMGRAVAAALPEGERHASFDLKVNFVAPARLGEPLRARARVIHSGRRTSVAECRLEDAGGRLVATATASFIVHLPEAVP